MGVVMTDEFVSRTFVSTGDDYVIDESKRDPLSCMSLCLYVPVHLRRSWSIDFLIDIGEICRLQAIVYMGPIG